MSDRSYRSYSLNFVHESDAILNEFANGLDDLEKALVLETNNPNLGKIEEFLKATLRSQVWNRPYLIATPTLLLILQRKWYPQAGVELGVVDDAVSSTPPAELPFQDQPVGSIEVQI